MRQGRVRRKNPRVRHHALIAQVSRNATKDQVRRIVGCYTARWWIEEYHNALKSRAGVETSQLERADRLEALIAVLAVVAVRLLGTKLLARSHPASFEAAASFGPQMLAMLETKYGPPKGGWTNQNILTATARLGGFLARKHDGLPGWQTIWRDWQRLMWICYGVETLNQLSKRRLELFWRECFFDFGDRLVGKPVAAFVAFVAGMTFEPVPFYLVSGGGGIQRPPKIFIFHRFLQLCPPAIKFPSRQPCRHAIFHVLGVGEELNITWFLERVERFDCRPKFHAVVRGGRFTTA